MIWIVEGKEVIRLGDFTTHGGKVISASETAFYGNIPIARVGDQVSCPKCSGTHTIIEGASTCFDNNLPVALDGHKVSCGARLIARNTKKDEGQPARTTPVADYHNDAWRASGCPVLIQTPPPPLPLTDSEM